jgi:hypothetical protein
MNRKILILLACAAGLGSLPGLSRAEVNVAVSANSNGVQSFYLGIGDYYHVPEREVIVVRDRHIPDDEIPVVFFLASRSGVAPSVIIEQRLSGRSWMDISLNLGLSPEIFYVPYEGNPGPPYGHAYGYYKNHPRREWKRIRLADAEVVNMVNLRFMTEHYGYSPREVVAMRGEGRHFQEISGRGHGHGDGNQGGNGRDEKDGKKDGEGHKGKSKGHGHGHGKD